MHLSDGIAPLPGSRRATSGPRTAESATDLAADPAAAPPGQAKGRPGDEADARTAAADTDQPTASPSGDAAARDGQTAGGTDNAGDGSGLAPAAPQHDRPAGEAPADDDRPGDPHHDQAPTPVGADSAAADEARGDRAEAEPRGDGEGPGEPQPDQVEAAEARAAGVRDATAAVGRAHLTEQIEPGHRTVQIDTTRRNDAAAVVAGAADESGPSGEQERDEFTRPTEQITLDRRTARGTAGSGRPGTDGSAGDGAPVPVPDDVMVFPEPDGARTRLPEQVGARSDGSFWLTAIENGETWPDEDPGPVRMQTATVTRPRRTEVPKQPRRPAFGLLALVVLALLGAFFAWTSAAPLWLAVGHGEAGTVTVTRCTGAGMTERCAGTFVARGGWTASDVSVLGDDGSARAAGAVLPARMVTADGGQAYVNASGWTLHVRWVIGLALVLLCGLGIASATGARRLETARARRRAVLASIGAPFVVLAGFLVAAF
jgi:hypothetical protein